MKRAMKNGLMFAAMAVAVLMVTLTLLHGYGVIGKTAMGTPPDSNGGGRGPGDNAGNFDPAAGGAMTEAGEEIGEVTLPETDRSDEPPMSKPTAGENAPGEGGTPTEMPGRNAGMEERPGNATLGGHLAFATVWILLFAFCLSWAILTRCNSEKGRNNAWKSKPVSNGTN